MIIIKSSFTCQTFWGFYWNNVHKTHLKVAFSFNRFLDLYFLFIEDIWNYVQKGSESIIISTSCQTLSVSTAISYLVDLCTKPWCNNPKANFFLGATFLDLASSFFYQKHMFPLCTMWHIHPMFLLVTKVQCTKTLVKLKSMSQFH